MRYRSLGWIIMGAWFGIWPIAAHADYMSNARDALKKGDLKSAQIDLRNAVRNDPQNAEAHFWLGKVAIELGDPVAGEREATAAWERGFDPSQSVPLLAQALMAQGKFAVLLEKLKPTGKDPALDASILVSRGYAQVGLRNMDDAQKSFADAEAAAPNAVEPLLADARLAVARNDLKSASEKIDRAVAAQPKSADALLAKAQLLRLKNDADGALAVLDGLVADQPSVTQARLDRAGLTLAMGKNDLAKADIDAVLKSTRGNIQATYLEAVLRAQTKDYKGADEDLTRVEAYLGRVPRGYYLKAMVKEQLGLLAEADEAARKYLARAPNDLSAYKILARIQFLERRPDQVIETLAKIAESGKADAQTYDLLGRAYSATNRPADAIQAFQKAEALSPNDVAVQTRLASARMGMGEIDAAVGDLEHTLELAPKVPAVGEALFFAALASGNLDKAAEALGKVRTTQGDTPTVGNLEGLMKLATLDLAGAEKQFNAVLRKTPDFTPSIVNLARVKALSGNTQEAETMLADVLAKDATSEPALSMLVASFVESGRMQLAIALMERANGKPGRSSRIVTSLGDLYIRSGTPQKAIDLIGSDKGGGILPTEMLSLRASAQLALGQKKEARDTYTELLKKEPSVIGARRQLTALLLDSGDAETARSVINAGIAASPRNYQLYQDLVMVDLRATGIDAALATADRIVSQDRPFTQARALKGDAYLAANRPADAVTSYTEALKAVPTPFMMNRLAGAQLRAGQPEEAVKSLTEWVGSHADDVGALEQLAEILIALNRLPQAATNLEAILKLKPHEPIALNNLAWVYQQQNDKRALGLARQAYVLAPSAQTADTLGWILVSTGQSETAVPLLRQALAEAGKDPRVRFHYAVGLKNTGKKDEAIKRLTEVVQTNGEFKEKAEAQKMLEELQKGS